MKKNLLLFLVLGSLSTFAGKVKSEEICYYSNVKDFKNCRTNKQRKIVPKYPILVEDQTKNSLFYYFMWSGDEPYILQSSNYSAQTFNKLNFTSLKIKSNNGDNIQLEFTEKTARNRIFGVSTKINSKRSINIDSKDILSWNYSFKDEYSPGCLVNCEMRLSKFKLKYLDDFGNKKEIKGNYRTNYREGSSIVKNLLENISKLKMFESRNQLDSLNAKLQRNEKRYSIIRNNIIDDDPKLSNCLQLNEVKFPKLSSELKNLSKKINSLRNKLNLPPNTKLKKICGEIPGRRPLWMEKKMKECFEFSTKKERDYCINIYSPYGK